MGIGLSDVTTVHSINPNRYRFMGGSDARITMSRDEAARIQLCTDDHSRVPATKSPTAQAQFLRPIRAKHSRASHKQRQAGEKPTTFMPHIRRFMKAYATLWQKLYARSSERSFDQGNRVLVSRIATHLDIHDRVSVQTGPLHWVLNRPIQRSTRHQDLYACHRPENRGIARLTPMITMSPNQGGSSELDI
jgi:hypothetical protein